ncbi:M48 family peptidase [Luteimonas aestuarii]|uniref:Putative beta-barrel assembly-enhancing protease n=2 Tax=Luteimonas aestuarii TaxID=453837 RepID=A0A4V3AN04_9GAMM|nr:M48 family metalloprotease [Luteimonas aestuarii]TDK28785.1 M48 family peptidase [Luteimonas aestuarii]
MGATAQESRLPDIGSSAGTLIGPVQQEEYGRMLLAQLRHYNYVLEDPLIDGWLQSAGNRLGAVSDQPRQRYTFFMMRDRSINAFATLGGYIGMNAGLVLTAGSEDEVAAVLAHEIAHVTQQHVLRGVERAQRDQIPILLGMLGAIAVAQSAGGSSAGDASMAAMAAAQGLAIQRQIDYTRANESEADRLGIRTLARSGYEPMAMATMFERMQAASRTNQGGERERAPDYLRTHPVTTTRVGEARQRAEQMAGNANVATSVTWGQAPPRAPAEGAADPLGTASDNAPPASDLLLSGNPLLPSSLRLPEAGGNGPDPVQFGWAKERLRVLSANTPAEAIREYEQMQRAGQLTDAQRYGLAVARLQDGRGAASAATEFAELLQSHPGDLWLSLGLAEAEERAGRPAQADRHLDSLLERMPHNPAVALTYARVLVERDTPESGRRAQAVLRPLMRSSAEDPMFQRTFARASEIAGDPVRAGEAWAEAAFLSGREEQALVQLNTLKKRDDLDYYARARIDARIATITPVVLELRRQGIRDEDLRRR